ncbi:ATP-dependent DNA helicase [candidate division FCPU426 bacterium]|nr:ATP-dependent DNA helicase [candidate division FCPU426 bacterium]
MTFWRTPAEIAAVFAPQGELAKRIPGFHARREQIALAQSIQAALEEKTHCLAEAGTGVGKSLAYLATGINWVLEHRTRLLVSTYTKALQMQLLNKELPRLAEEGLFARPFTYAICVGAENYICLWRLLREGSREPLPVFDPEYIQALRRCLEWCKEPVSGLRQDLPMPVPDGLWYSICIVSELCLATRCSFYHECFLQLARQRQRAADVLVANHYLFFTNLINKGRVLPEYTVAVLDEAHKLEDVATQFLGETIAQADVGHLLAGLTRRGRMHFLDNVTCLDAARREKVRAQAVLLSEQQERWWKSLLPLFPLGSDTLRITGPTVSVPAPDTKLLAILAEEFMQYKAAAETEEEEKKLEYYASQLAAVAQVEEGWHERISAEKVYWAEKEKLRTGTCIRLHITPLEVSRHLAELVFASIPTVVLTSATLSLDGDFTYLGSRLGVSRAREISVPSPFPYQQNAALFIPEHVPDPKNAEAFIAYLLTAVEELVQVFNGGIFVLCTSYRVLKKVAEYLRSRDDHRVCLVQGEDSTQRLIDVFQRDTHAVMLGVETFWQGVDIPGQALRCVVITRLPFDVPTHPLHQARAEDLQIKGVNPFLAYSVPRAALMLKQGFGRLIRRQDDKGVVAILDPRVKTRSWGDFFIHTLPSCPRLSAFSEVREFVKTRFPGGCHSIRQEGQAAEEKETIAGWDGRRPPVGQSDSISKKGVTGNEY